jgi:hypothetical protein
MQIKPTEVTVPNTLKMSLRSVYQSNFNGATRPRAESGKIPDNLHGGLPWTGGSTYRQLFKGASPSLVRDTPSRMEMKVDDPNYAHQYCISNPIKKPHIATNTCWEGRNAAADKNKAILFWPDCSKLYKFDHFLLLLHLFNLYVYNDHNYKLSHFEQGVDVSHSLEIALLQKLVQFILQCLQAPRLRCFS